MSIHTCSYYCERPDCIRAQRDELRQKLEQAIQAEREACAKVCETFDNEEAGDCAEAIRARGET
jgi:hypothetical protein